jgi:hypothetical protein
MMRERSVMLLRELIKVRIDDVDDNNNDGED